MWTTEKDDIVRNELTRTGTVSSLVTLADSMGRSPGSIYRHMRRLKAVSGSQLINHRKPWTDAELIDAKSLRKEGQTYLQIAARLDRTTDAVFHKLRAEDRMNFAMAHTGRKNTTTAGQ